MSQTRLSDVSPPRQDFIRRCQRIGFGKVIGLVVRDGEPLFGEHTEVLIDLKLDGDETPRWEQDLPDYVLCAEVLKLLSKLESIRDGVIEHIEVRAGIPRRMVFKAPEQLHR